MKKTLLPKILETGANELEIIDFRMYELLDNERIYEWILGVNVAKVKEVIFKPDEIIKAPGMPLEVEGLSKIRKQMVPIINLARWMKIKESKNAGRYVIVMEFLRETIGVVVHEAKRIRRIKWTEIKRPPASVVDRLGGKVVGVVEIESNRLLLLLDFEGILDELGMIKIFGVEEGTEIPEPEIKRKEHYNVLILDDSPVARRIIKNILEKEGHNVYEAQNGIEGLQMLYRWLEEAKTSGKDITSIIQLIISDIEMPGMDGLTFTRKLREDPELKKIPVIINTSLSDKANIDKSKFVGADAHLVKFNASSLVTLVHKYAARGGSQDEHS